MLLSPSQMLGSVYILAHLTLPATPGGAITVCLPVGIQKLAEGRQLAQIMQLQSASHKSRVKPRPATS